MSWDPLSKWWAMQGTDLGHLFPISSTHGILLRLKTLNCKLYMFSYNHAFINNGRKSDAKQENKRFCN